ncbi:hypothetical protein LUZ60_009660 [Juncus effusus]|nr:hypothetical protein LUZ60_009660 [Juncus effusus]
MQSISPPLSSHSISLTSLLNRCNTMNQFKQIHSQSIRTGLANSPLTQHQLFSFCSAQAWTDMDYAHNLFDQITEPDISLYNALIHGYTVHKSPESALVVYINMVSRGFRPDKETFALLIKGFTRKFSVLFGDEIHAHVVKFGFGLDSHVMNALIRMYILTEEFEAAHELFDEIPKRDSFMWNSLICGYNKIERFDESFSLFKQMVSQHLVPSILTYISVLSACIKLKDLEFGVQIHLNLEEIKMLPNLRLENKLLEMYIECGAIGTARRLFDELKKRNVMSWSLLINGFLKSGQIDNAHKLFNEMPERNSVSYTTMINSYVKINRFKEALEIFQEAQIGEIKIDNLTMVSLVNACAEVGALEIGESLRAYMNKSKFKMEISIGNSLIEMYLKCGSISNALEVFYKMPQRDINTWREILNGLAINGKGENALKLFSKMIELNETLNLNEEIFEIILKACAYSGLIVEGRSLFIRMIDNYNIMPNVTHYWCIISLLGRAGRLKEAFETILNMPMNPNYEIWGTFLGACRVIGSVEFGELAFKKLIELDSNNSLAYLLLSNLYAKCERWKDARKIRNVMILEGFNKEKGISSFIELEGKIHEFFASDMFSESNKNIYAKLKEMEREMRSAGYLYNSEEPEEEREKFVYCHSEKLALAFGLVNLDSRVKIRIVKNSRVCVDCHNEIKMVSRIYGREIIVRDGARFHHFKYGSCSCKDYW